MSMLHSLDITSAKALLKELKPLIILYLEEFTDVDKLTKKPVIKTTNLPNLYRIARQHGISLTEWGDLIEEFAKIKVVPTKKVREHLKKVRQEAHG